MHYINITRIGESYEYEVGTSGHRTTPRTWKKIEDKLKAAMVDLNNALQQTNTQPTATNFASKKQFFEAQSFAARSKAEDERSKKIAEARARIAECRLWLKREGATADANGNVIMGPMANLKVYYDTEIARQGLTQIHFSGGKLFSDAACRQPLGTAGMVTHFSGPGKAIYVMSPAGNIHLGSHVVGHYHHSSLLAGAPVACAGEIEAKDGAIVWISNKSGHYTPNPDHLIQVLHQLIKKNVPMGFKVSAMYKESGALKIKDFPTVQELDQWLGAEGYNDYEVSKLLAYHAHLDDGLLVQNNWRWRTGAEEVGVYDKSTNAKVPHKVVRQWLKSHGYHATDQIQSGVGR